MVKNQKKQDCIVLCVLVLISAAAIIQIPKITVDGSSDIFIPENHQVTMINNHIEEAFGSMDSIILGVQVNLGSILEPEILTLISHLTSELEKLEEVDQVISLTNADYIKSSAEGMEVVPLMEETSSEGIAVLKERLIDWADMYIGNFISEDNSLGVIIIQVQSGGGDKANQIIYQHIKSLVKEYQSANISFPVAGLPVLKEEISQSILSDMLYLIPLVLILIVAILFLSFRRWEGLCYPLFSLSLACLWALGVMGALNLTFTMASMLVPILLLVVGSAYGIHLMSHFYDEISRQSGFLNYDAVCEILNRSMKNIRISVILAGATTAGGFISQLSSPLGPFRAFGVLSALGVVFSQITMFLLIPVLLRFQYSKGINTDKFHKNITMGMRSETSKIFTIFENIARHKKVLIMLFSSVLIITTLALIPRIKVGINLLEFFKKDSAMVQDTKIFNDNLGGTGMVSVLIEAPRKGDILRPSFLKKIESFEEYIQRRHSTVGGVMTLVPHIKRINKIMNYNQIPFKIVEETASFDFFAEDSFFTEKAVSSDIPLASSLELKEESFTQEEIVQQFNQALLEAGSNPDADELIKAFLAQSNFQGAAFDEIPLNAAKYALNSQDDLQNLLAQYLLLYSGSLNMIINDSLEPDSTLLSIQITDEDTQVLDILMHDIRKYWDHYLQDGWRYSIGGSSSISYALSSLVTKSQLYSLAGALIIVFIIVSLMFRSLLGGLIGMIPVLFGVIGIFLFMILFNFNLDIVTSLLAAIAIGIGVDYAIHYMNAYKRCKKESNVLNAVYRTTGKAILVNAVSVAAGFMGLLISRFVPIQQLGILFSVSMFFACMASLIVLPMVLEHCKPAFLNK